MTFMGRPMMLAKCHGCSHVFENIEAYIFTFHTRTINLNYVKIFIYQLIKKEFTFAYIFKRTLWCKWVITAICYDGSFFPRNKRVHLICFPLNKFRWKSTSYIRPSVYVILDCLRSMHGKPTTFMSRFQNKAYTCKLNNYASFSSITRVVI